jgi:hypothetical protein
MSQGEASQLLRTWEFRGYAHYSEWPKVADAVIEAVYLRENARYPSEESSSVDAPHAASTSVSPRP